MATSITPFVQNSAFAFQQSRTSQSTPNIIYLHFQTIEWCRMTPEAKLSESFSKTRKARIHNYGSFTDTSVTENGVLKNVAVLLYSMDFTNPYECCETYALILKKCRKLGNLELGFQVHAHLIVCGVELCEFLGSQLLELYCELGCVEVASKLFGKMSERNVLSWTSMMDMYCGLGDYKEAVFKACSELKDYQAGKDVYDYMSCIGFEGNASVKRSFIEMFAKCGRTDIARPVFEEIKFKDIVMWNIMVSGYAAKGDFKTAWRYINAIKLDGITPDQVTWNSIIAGYVQNGQLIEAFKYLKELSDSKDNWPNVDELDSDLLVSNSLVDFYAKRWSLKGARQKFDDIKRKDLVSWNAMLFGYAYGGYYKEAIKLLNKMGGLGGKSDIVTWNEVITGCTRAGDGKSARAFLYRMCGTGI
ncbi:Pentatricopeptide repeat [Trema orientale]|uniref:Pentatricopeptide repeat n=1 Tax=Trema orientale TaxID=63057 RepID=A0A2P5CEX5_TREOI|nr:Pentatricopeptide repeat [Trema orientale]